MLHEGDARAEDLRTVRLAEDTSGSDADTSEPGIESALALERARRRLVGQAPAPVRVGRYRIVERLGRGGMGVVYAAHDDELDRTVAVKVLRADLARDDGSRRRLLREAQAMARLSHPNVGHVYEVARHGGQVFIAMERVVGSTLRAWCRAPGRTWREVVRMHASAGDGLAAAHAVGLVHRDYKCDNVLVGEDGRPRVLDFGLARSDLEPSSSDDGITLPSGGDGSRITRDGTVLGTPAYMAPEQHSGGSVDTRADQFSFCVALFECLYGERPFRGSSMAELRERVRTQPPVSIDPRAHGVPAGLHAAIVRGLAVDPDERHPAMTDLLAALREHLRDPSRTRWIVVGVLAAAAVAGTIGLGREAMRRRAEIACARAGAEIDAVWGEAARSSVRAGLLQTAVSHARVTADKVLPMLDASANAWRDARTQACLAVDVDRTWDADLAAAATWCFDERRMELEALVAELADADAGTVENAVEAAASLSSIDPCLREGVLQRLPTPPAEHAEEIRSVHAELQRALALQLSGRSDDGLEIAEAAHDDANALAWPPLQAAAQLRLGFLLHEEGRYDAAERALEDAYFQALHAGANEVEADAAVKLVATVGMRLARHAEGRRWSRHAEAAIAELGEGQQLRMADNLGNLALVLEAEASYAEAKAMHERALAIWEHELGPDHLMVAVGLGNLGIVQDSLGEFADARASYERALEIQERVLGPEHPDVAATLSNVASVHYATGAFDEARPLHERALAIRERVLGPEHPAVALSLNNLGTLLQATGAPDEARPLHERALRIREATLGPHHPDVAQSLFNLAGVHWASGDLERAKAMLVRTLDVHERALGPEHPHVARSLDSLAAVHYSMGEYSQAQGLFERALTTFEAALGPEHVDVAYTLVNLAGAHWAQHAYPQARAHYERALAILERAFGPEHADLADVLHGLAEAELGDRRPATAAARAERALRLREHSGASPTQLAGTRFVLARALWDAKIDRARARELAQQARAAYRSAGETKANELAKIDAWLRAR
jgi:tetratricopeptide (TPR) repeat protein/predicted Ser/Thr protein kinase